MAAVGADDTAQEEGEAQGKGEGDGTESESDVQMQVGTRKERQVNGGRKSMPRHFT